MTYVDDHSTLQNVALISSRHGLRRRPERCKHDTQTLFSYAFNR